MSKLLEYLKVHQTSERRYQVQPLKLVSGTTDIYESPALGATVYRVEARLGSQAIISDQFKHKEPDINAILRARVYAPLAEEIFGEFRQPLLDADLAIMQGDYHKASELIGRVLTTMFKV